MSRSNMNDAEIGAALEAAGRVAAAYATARPAVTSEEHTRSIVRVFEAIFDAAVAKMNAAAGRAG